MGITNQQSGTRIDEVAPRIYRISTPVREVPGGFSFNQYLVDGDEPLLFHTGPRALAALTAEAIRAVLPLDRLRFLGFSHYESDECGALNALLALAPDAVPLCGRINGLINSDAFDRAPRALADGEVLDLGSRRFRWFDTPHLPHGWDCGYLYEAASGTLLCGDLFTQGGADNPPLVTTDILGPSEAFRKLLDYDSHTRNVRALVARLAETRPTTLACMHGSAWQGDGAKLLTALGEALATEPA